jgi:5-methylcytosine-specific restriction endonuclease McrA
LPVIIELIADSSLHLTAVSLLAPHLTADNHRDVLESARHKSKRAVEEIVAALRPQPSVPSSVRKLPARLAAERTETLSDSCTDQPASMGPIPAAVTSASAQSPPIEPPAAGRFLPKVTPLAPERYKVQFTVSRETHDRLREAQDLLRHRIPDGDVAAIFDRALTLLLADLRKIRHAEAHRPRAQRSNRPLGRYVPAAVKREVWTRDAGRCAFIGTVGRCSERGFLEYHHVVPHADGGATTADNLELRCRAHNACEATRWFGVSGHDVVREHYVDYVATG